jgi:hypothetical protein
MQIQQLWRLLALTGQVLANLTKFPLLWSRVRSGQLWLVEVLLPVAKTLFNLPLYQK